jgi:PBP1b-binding outer membrane lipoprotein LpoB
MLTISRVSTVAAVLAGMVVSGCAFTADRVVIDHHLSATIQPVTPDEKVLITIGQIEDKRGVEDPNIIMHKRNLNGNVTSGSYQAEKPLSDIVRDALAEAFPPVQASNGRRNYKLYGKLLDFSYESVMGLTKSKINSKLSVQLYLEDTATGQVVWSEAFIGLGQVKEFSGEQDAIAKMVGFAIDDLVRQVVTSKPLLQHLQKT